MVDFENKFPNKEPDFYVLSHNDYKITAQVRVNEVVHRAGRNTYPVSRDPITGSPKYVNEILKGSGKPYEGCSLRPDLVMKFKNKWETILDFFSKT